MHAASESIATRLAPALHIVPLPAAYLARVRAGRDDLGQPVERHSAKGGEPLRDCLRRARPGEAILLASYCPFALAGPYKEYGPVFVSAAAQEEPRVDELPLAGAQPYLGEAFVLRAYSQDERIVDARMSSPALAAQHLADFFARQSVGFVLARFPTYGCYALRVGRAS